MGLVIPEMILFFPLGLLGLGLTWSLLSDLWEIFVGEKTPTQTKREGRLNYYTIVQMEREIYGQSMTHRTWDGRVLGIAPDLPRVWNNLP